MRVFLVFWVFILGVSPFTWAQEKDGNARFPYVNRDYWLPGSEMVLDAILTGDGSEIIRSAITAKGKNELIKAERKTFKITMTYTKTKGFSQKLVSGYGGNSFFTLVTGKGAMAQLFSGLLPYPVKDFKYHHKGMHTGLFGIADSDRSLYVITPKGDLAYLHTPTSKALFSLRPKKGSYLDRIALSPDLTQFAVQTSTHIHIGNSSLQNVTDLIPLKLKYGSKLTSTGGLLFLDKNNMIVTQADVGSELVDVVNKQSMVLPAFKDKKGRSYKGYRKLIFGGGNAWLLGYQGNELHIINKNSLEITATAVAFGSSPPDEIMDIQSSFDQRFILVRTVKGSLYRLEWVKAGSNSES